MRKQLFFLIVALLGMAIPQRLMAYDFLATVPSGQTLCFKYVSGGGVMVTILSSSPSNPYGGGTIPTGALVIPATIEYNGVTWNIVGIDSYTFYNCTGLTSVTIECTGSIGERAFYHCSGITSLVIGDGINSIGAFSFQNCTQITTATIGNGCQSIGSSAFHNCRSMNTISLGSALTSIGENGYYGCNGLTNITCHASNPPYAYSNTFIGVSSNSPLHVPCGKANAYRSDARWSQFVNITEMASPYTTIVNTSNALMGSANVDVCGTFVTASANNGYHFVQWNDGNNINPRVLTLTSDTSLTAMFAPNQYTITCSALSGGTVTGGGMEDYLDSVILTATPNEGYAFTKWCTRTGTTYEDYSTNNPLIVEVTENMTYYAMFERIVCNVAALPSDSTMGYTTGSGTVYYGNNVQLQAYANTGYRFVGWSDGVIASSRSVHVTSDMTLTAIFEPIPQYVLSLGINNSIMGNVSGGGTFYEGTAVTFSATANVGYHFVGWSDGIVSATRSITMTADTTISANFEYIEYAVQAQSGNLLRGSVDGSDTVHYGETVTLTATPNEHYTFQYWQTAGGITYGQNPLTITVTDNGTYTAIFAAEQHSVAVLTDGGGTVRIGASGNSGNYDYFTQLTLTATANGNNAFLRWSDGNTFNPRTVTITSDTVFTALFLNGTTFLHDTIIDTIYFNHYTHDTTYINHYIHDTVYLYQTLYETIHDTLMQFVNQYVHDTTFVNNYVHDTVLITTHVFDTTIVNIYQFDTSIYNTHTYDTTIININQFDTTIVNTFVYDTVWQHDTVYIHEEGIDGVDVLNAKVYIDNGQIVVEGAEGNLVNLYDVNGRLLATRRDDFTPLRFDAPASGTYMIKVGNHPARKVVVIR